MMVMRTPNKGIDSTSQVLGYHGSQRARVMPNTLAGRMDALGMIRLSSEGDFVESKQSDSELLQDSRERAKRLLADSARDAQAVLDDAHREAVALLLEEQQRAADILLGEVCDAARSSDKGVRAAGRLPEAGRERSVTDHDGEVADVLARQEAAAQRLLGAQHKVAARLNHAVESASADILMTGQKEAAAILLEARLRVQDRRH